MSKIVFVLGAGASVHSGTPLMNNFLEIAQDLLRRGEVEEAKADFENVFDAVGKLHAAQSKAIIDTYNIEDVYAAFEMGKLLGRLPGIEELDQIDGLISSIKKVIGFTLEKTMRLPTKAEINGPVQYDSFVDIINTLLSQKVECSIITFNYDLGLDYSLYKRKIIPNYGLEDVRIGVKAIPYLKLHGSINWGRCNNNSCRKVVAYRNFGVTEYQNDLGYSILPMISKLRKMKCPFCNNELDKDPFIVPPTWNKTAFHEQIDIIWKKAAIELKDSEQIIIIGYSFPPTDMFFRYLFALGVDLKTILKGFYVYNPDPEVEGRFRNLLSSGIEQRFHFYNVSFENAIGQGPFLMGTNIETIQSILNV